MQLRGYDSQVRFDELGRSRFRACRGADALTRCGSLSSQAAQIRAQ
ncbi:MAG: hypothetical protein K6F68_00805 [Clostridiales bacterium]|nr:hypothetical protein [Clostridiales bacterium]